MVVAEGYAAAALRSDLTLILRGSSVPSHTANPKSRGGARAAPRCRRPEHGDPVGMKRDGTAGVTDSVVPLSEE
ncbi:hypothetical protein EYF80_025231 [Liparis tanakae]|uniref:Uncharacterized protein n=1 Tax=Liparis tanakae TaxID=230148 RepID=A0A4Z2HI65_9TELE|nr:hypothetical protein EYF80_025231 [Liparis tanakae]